MARFQARPLSDVGRAAIRTFITKGYRRTGMADVARELALTAGALYGYVESKQALFHLAVATAAQHDWPETAEVPVRTPLPGETMHLVEKWISDDAGFPVLKGALARRRAPAPGEELVAVLQERYRYIERSRRLLALLEQSALDLPELFELYYRSRREQIDELARYLAARQQVGAIRFVGEPPTAARFIVEAIAWFGWHRRGDPDSATINDDEARVTTIGMLLAAFGAT